MEPMYGLIPLKFNGGRVANILFFAPAAFYNLREVYPFYEFEVAQGVVRYKKNEQISGPATRRRLPKPSVPARISSNK